MTRGRAATPDPFDIGAVNRSGELFDALAARKFADPGDDPAARLLAALVADVDVGAPPLPIPARLSSPRTGPRRRVVRTFVTLGVTAAVLTTAGAAAAGGGGGGKDATGVRAPHVKLSEGTNGSVQVGSPMRADDDRSPTAPDPHRRQDDEVHRAVHRPQGDAPKRGHWVRDRGVAPDPGPITEQQGPGDQGDQGDQRKFAVHPTPTPTPTPTTPTPSEVEKP